MSQIPPPNREDQIKRASVWFLRGASARLMAAPNSTQLLTKAASASDSLKEQANQHVRAFIEAADILREVANGQKTA